MHRHATRIAFALVLLAAGAAAQQRSLTLTAAHDNTLYEDPAGLLSNGSGEHFFAGLSGAGIRRGLIAFDLAPLPPAALILEAHLQLNLSRSVGEAAGVSVHRALHSWGEGASDAPGEEGAGGPAAPGDATWLHRSFDDTLWEASGGDFEPVASAEQLVAAVGPYEWTSQQLAADVQDWSLNRVANFGWVLVGDEQAAGTAKRFDSREIGDVALRPALQIEYFLRCPWDLNNTGMIDVSDLAILLSHFGAPSAGPADGDIDDDGDVDIADLAAELSWFGRVCPP